jgi:hypothetical protein
MKKVLPILFGSMLLLACSQHSTPDNQAAFRVNPIELDWANDAADVYVRFNIIDKSVDDKVLWSELSKENIEVLFDNKSMTVKDVTKLTNQKGSIPDNILVMLLVDRSIHNDDMENVRQAVSNFVGTLPENTVYISFFDEQLRSSKRITSENFNDFQNEFTITSNYKYIFDAALKKFQELCGEKGLTTDQRLIERIENADIKKYLVLLTDGRIDENNALTAFTVQKFSDYVQTWDKDATNNNRVEIHAIRFGDVRSDVDQTLSYLCVDLRNANVKGGLYIADPDAFIAKLMVTDKTYPDYELTIANPAGETGYGAGKNMQIRIHANGKTADGQSEYALGTLMKPVKSGFDNHWRQLWVGALFSIALMMITFFVLYILIPFLKVYLSDFDKKYVRYYSFDDGSVLQCHYCKNEILDGDEIVVKCKHTVHKHCWVENGCKCADYGENCKEGKQFFFDTGKLLQRDNRLFYADFALWGMIGGLVSWLIYHLITYWFPYPFEAFTSSLLAKFYPGYGENPVVFLRLVLMLKTGSIMLAGLLSGFILLFVILYRNKYREKHFSVMRVVLKSMLGALVGWASFLLGAILVIYCKAGVNTAPVEWIPWALSGCVWGWCLSLRTNAVMLHTMTGGLIAGLVGFFVLFLGKFFGAYAVLFGFMALGAALGIAFISARRTVHKYYLTFQQGNETAKVAIHKWMSVAGGSRDVTIGKSGDCTICMNWDTHNSVRDVNVSLYVDKKDKTPVLKVMDDYILYNRTVARKNEEFVLKHGARFKIGNTEFRYVE